MGCAIFLSVAKLIMFANILPSFNFYSHGHVLKLLLHVFLCSRLVSERTVEENILKKANQKRLLGDLAIEGGNFTTAYFKTVSFAQNHIFEKRHMFFLQTTIQDLFEIDASESAATRLATVAESGKEAPAAPSAEEKTAVGALENALASCEDDQDVMAANTAKAEAVADLAEFDETIPLQDDPEKEKEREPEVSKAEQEVENLVKQVSL